MQENNKNELERLDKERHDDFVNMLKGFVVNQVFIPDHICIRSVLADVLMLLFLEID